MPLAIVIDETLERRKGKQIKAKGYHQQYVESGKKVILMGIGFDVPTRNIGGFLVEELG